MNTGFVMRLLLLPFALLLFSLSFAGQASAQSADSGKSCTTSKDCSGFCLAESRTCSIETSPKGCFDFINESGEIISICID